MDNNILSVEALTVSFSGFIAMDKLDFNLARGELRFLIGPNGAGKTTLLDLITGKTRPTGGKIVYDGGTDLTKMLEHDLVKLGIGRKFQTPSVFASLTVYENMEVAVGFRRRLTSLLRPLPNGDAQWINATLEQVGACQPGWRCGRNVVPRGKTMAGDRDAACPGTQAAAA